MCHQNAAVSYRPALPRASAHGVSAQGFGGFGRTFSLPSTMSSRIETLPRSVPVPSIVDLLGFTLYEARSERCC